ncbi:uncharacterized protein [Miscanthus floridulus]|uniref:uncharacterized protein n=1 Tax=Miscanthus floridulus TaxID=154761 RepID=UPI00345B440D
MNNRSSRIRLSPTEPTQISPFGSRAAKENHTQKCRTPTANAKRGAGAREARRRGARRPLQDPDRRRCSTWSESRCRSLRAKEAAEHRRARYSPERASAAPAAAGAGAGAGELRHSRRGTQKDGERARAGAGGWRRRRRRGWGAAGGDGDAEPPELCRVPLLRSEERGCFFA